MDILSISPGVSRYSSEGWDVRIFIAKEGAAFTRDLAPELNHAGLLLIFGSGQSRPDIFDANMPLFGENTSFPKDILSGAMFMTASQDDLKRHELEEISRLIFEHKRAAEDIPPRLKRSADLFRSVLSDAFHNEK